MCPEVQECRHQHPGRLSGDLWPYPPIARRLVGWWSRSVMTRGEKWARASLVSMGMEADPRSFPEAADLAWYPDRLV